MDNTIAAESTGSVSTSTESSAYQMPISFFKVGDEVRIVKIRGKEDLRHHLENLGFVEGAKVKIVNKANQDLILEIKGTQLGVNSQVASHIICC